MIRRVIFMIQLLISFQAQKLIIENFTVSQGASGTVYNVEERYPGLSTVTLLFWVGVMDVGYCFMGLQTPNEAIDFKTKLDGGFTKIAVEGNLGSSTNIGTSTALVNSRKWYRVAVSFERQVALSNLFVFVDGEQTSISSNFLPTEPINLFLGICNSNGMIAQQNVDFFNFFVLNGYYTNLESATVFNNLFKFPPVLKLLTQLYKHGTYNKTYTNHVISEKDIVTGGLNEYTRYETSLTKAITDDATNIKLPSLSHPGFDVSQSYLVFFKIDFSYKATAGNGSNDLILYVRKNLLNAELIKLSIEFINPGGTDDASVGLKTDATTIGTIGSQNNTSGVFETVSFRYVYLAVTGNVFEANNSITTSCDHFPAMTIVNTNLLSSTDEHFLGDDTNTLAYMLSQELKFFLVIHEVAIFNNSFVEEVAVNDVRTGFDIDRFHMDCPAATEGIRRVALADPYDIINDTCVAESFVNTGCTANCQVCDAGVCYICETAYELVAGVCNKCVGTIWNPLSRKCGSGVAGPSIFVNSSPTTKNIDPNTASYAASFDSVEGNGGAPLLGTLTSTVFKFNFPLTDLLSRYRLETDSTLYYYIRHCPGDCLMDEDGSWYPNPKPQTPNPKPQTPNPIEKVVSFNSECLETNLNSNYSNSKKGFEFEMK